MNRQQRRNAQKARKAVLALLVAGALAAGGDLSVNADTPDLIVGDSLAIIGGGSGGGGGGGGSGTSPGGGGGGGAGAFIEYIDSSGAYYVRGSHGLGTNEMSGDTSHNGSPGIDASGGAGGQGQGSGGAGGAGGSSGLGYTPAFSSTGDLSDKNIFDTVTANPGVNGANGGSAGGGIGGTGGNGGAGGGATFVAGTGTKVKLETLTLSSGVNGFSGTESVGQRGGSQYTGSILATFDELDAELINLYSGAYGGSPANLTRTPGGVHLTVGTLHVSNGYVLNLYSANAVSYCNVDSYVFDLTGASDGDILLQVNGSTSSALYSYTIHQKTELTGDVSGLLVGDKICLLSRGYPYGMESRQIEHEGLIFELGFGYNTDISDFYYLEATVVGEDPIPPPPPGTHNIVFNANGGAGAMGYANVVDGTPYEIKANTFTRDGYDFTGWNTERDGSGEAYADGETIPAVTASITLYAQWTLRGEPTPAPRRESTTPQTGTESNVAIMAALMATSAVGGLCAIFALRRNRRKTR